MDEERLLLRDKVGIGLASLGIVLFFVTILAILTWLLSPKEFLWPGRIYFRFTAALILVGLALCRLSRLTIKKHRS